MRFGVHVRIAQGLAKSLDRARALECQTIQLFSGNPSGWKRKPLDLDAAAEFVSATRALDIRPVILHTPYLVNLASPSDDIWLKSVEALADAVWRAPKLGCDYVVTHIGSHKGAGYGSGISRVAQAVDSALQADPTPTIVLELGAGAGNSVGSSFPQVADILERIKGPGDRVGVCIDTAHLWAAGHDISTPEGVDTTLGELARLVGPNALRVVHLNDTLMELGSHRDRHHHVGQGRIGIEGFRAVVNHPLTRELPGIIETPGEDLEMDRENLDRLRSLRE